MNWSIVPASIVGVAVCACSVTGRTKTAPSRERARATASSPSQSGDDAPRLDCPEGTQVNRLEPTVTGKVLFVVDGKSADVGYVRLCGKKIWSSSEGLVLVCEDASGQHAGPFLSKQSDRLGASNLQGRCLRGKPDGWWRYSKASGDRGVLMEERYRRGVRDGPFRVYYPSGQLKVRGQYRDGQKWGTWTHRGPAGRLRRRVMHRPVGDTTPPF